MEEEKSFSLPSEDNDSHGWQKVTHAKKQRKNQSNRPAPDVLSDGSGVLADKDSVFKDLEKQSEERRRKLEAQRASTADEDEIQVRSRKNRAEDDEGDDASSDAKENNPPEANKKDKLKKVKKPKVTVAEAAVRIDSEDLAAFLSGVSESFEGQQDIQLMRFADYFGRAFSAVSASQFPWLKLFRESTLAKIADVPVSYISESVYKTSVDWISRASNEALGEFVLWLLDGILVDLGSKGPKKGGKQPSSKSQACHGDLAVGLYLWAHLVLPILGGKLGSNPQSRDMVLQLVERILGAPKARGILINGAVRKGERLIPPAALELLLGATFPATSARVKATERFEAIYPILKEVALAGSPRSKSMKQVSQQIQTVAVKAAGEGIPALSQEATSIFIWCLTQSRDCYKQWDDIYVDNIEASVAALRKLSEEWKTLSSKQSSLEALAESLTSFRRKNAKALSDGADAARLDHFRDADKYCKAILGKLSSGRRHGCWLKTMGFGAVALAVGAAVVYLRLDGLDWN